MDPLLGVRPKLELARILYKVPSHLEHPLRGCLTVCEPISDHPDVLPSSDALSPSHQCLYISMHTGIQAGVQGQALTISEVGADQRAIQGTVTECVQDWPWRVTLYFCICSSH